MLRYFYDCEFLENGRTIDLASIGIACEDGRRYYAVNANVHWECLGKPEWEWVRENVWKHLPTTGPGQLSLNRYNPDVKERWKIAQEVQGFLLYDRHGAPSKPELWADYSAYDHVALCQLWGRMVDLPVGIPMRTNDIVQFAEFVGVDEKDFLQQDPKTKHHALYDAEHNMRVFKQLWDTMLPPISKFKEPKPVANRVTVAQTYAGRDVEDLPILTGAEGVQIGNGNVQSNTFQ